MPLICSQFLHVVAYLHWARPMELLPVIFRLPFICISSLQVRFLLCTIIFSEKLSNASFFYITFPMLTFQHLPLFVWFPFFAGLCPLICYSLAPKKPLKISLLPIFFCSLQYLFDKRSYSLVCGFKFFTWPPPNPNTAQSVGINNTNTDSII